MDIRIKGGISPAASSWQGIFEGKDGRKAGSSQGGLHLSSMGNVKNSCPKLWDRRMWMPGAEIPDHGSRGHRTQGLVWCTGRTRENERKGKKCTFVQLSFSAEESWTQWSAPLTGVGASPCFCCRYPPQHLPAAPSNRSHANRPQAQLGKEGPGKAEARGTPGLIACPAASPTHCQALSLAGQLLS